MCERHGPMGWQIRLMPGNEGFISAPKVMGSAQPIPIFKNESKATIGVPCSFKFAHSFFPTRIPRQHVFILQPLIS